MALPSGQLHTTRLFTLGTGCQAPVATHVGELGPLTWAAVSVHVKASWSPKSGAVQSTGRVGFVIDVAPTGFVATPVSIHAGLKGGQVMAATAVHNGVVALDHSPEAWHVMTSTTPDASS